MNVDDTAESTEARQKLLDQQFFHSIIHLLTTGLRQYGHKYVSGHGT